MFFNKISLFEKINKQNIQVGTYILDSYEKYEDYIPTHYGIMQVIELSKRKYFYYKYVAQISNANIIMPYNDLYERRTSYKDECKILPKEYNHLIDKVLVFG